MADKSLPVIYNLDDYMAFYNLEFSTLTNEEFLDFVNLQRMQMKWAAAELKMKRKLGHKADESLPVIHNLDDFMAFYNLEFSTLTNEDFLNFVNLQSLQMKRSAAELKLKRKLGRKVDESPAVNNNLDDFYNLQFSSLTEEDFLDLQSMQMKRSAAELKKLKGKVDEEDMFDQIKRGKSKKKVTFRSPEVADVFIFGSQEYNTTVAAL